jgi:chemotaxis signal transduction protein
MIKAKPQETMVQILVAPFKHLQMAVKLESVRKVIRTPEIFKSGEKPFGIAHFEENEVMIVDLYQKIYARSNPESEGYLIILQSDDYQLYGVPVTMLPTMKVISSALLRPLPSDYRDRDALGIASHVVTITQNSQTQTIFLLDLQLLLRI